jgi:hypothetical protein
VQQKRHREFIKQAQRCPARAAGIPSGCVHTDAEAVVLPELRENCGVRLVPCTPQMDSGKGLTAIADKNTQITVPNAESSQREWPILKRHLL